MKRQIRKKKKNYKKHIYIYIDRHESLIGNKSKPKEKIKRKKRIYNHEQQQKKNI